MGLTLKITDLGFSKVFEGDENESSRTFVGTPGYMAPEIEALKRDQAYDAKKVDVYSIGAVWYYLLTGQVPTRYANNQPATREGKMTKEVRRLLYECSEETKSLIESCL